MYLQNCSTLPPASACSLLRRASGIGNRRKVRGASPSFCMPIQLNVRRLYAKSPASNYLLQKDPGSKNHRDTRFRLPPQQSAAGSIRRFRKLLQALLKAAGPDHQTASRSGTVRHRVPYTISQTVPDKMMQTALASAQTLPFWNT